MKSLTTRAALLPVILAWSATGCGNAITSPDLPVMRPASADADAGTWRMIVLARPDDVAVPPPASTASAEYGAELTQIAAAQRQLTDEQRDAVAYWSAGGVMRWNEILR